MNQEKRPPTPAEAVDLIIENTLTIRRLHLKFCAPSNCVSSSAIACKVLTHYGIAAIPLAVTAVVFSPSFSRWIIDHNGEMPDPDGEEMNQIADPLIVKIGGDKSGGYGSIDEQANTWAGHLVAVGLMGDKTLLIDWSLDQANRPDRGLIIAPLALKHDPKFVTKGGSVTWQGQDETVVIQYEPRFGESSFLQVEDWRSPMIDPLTEATVAILDRAWAIKQSKSSIMVKIDFDAELFERRISEAVQKATNTLTKSIQEVAAALGNVSAVSGSIAAAASFPFTKFGEGIDQMVKEAAASIQEEARRRPTGSPSRASNLSAEEAFDAIKQAVKDDKPPRFRDQFGRRTKRGKKGGKR